MDVNHLFFIVTGLGVFLSVFCAAFLWTGRAIAIDGKSFIEWKDVRIQTSLIGMIFLTSVALAAGPLYLYVLSNPPKQPQSHLPPKADEGDNPGLVELDGYYDFRSTPRNTNDILFDEEGHESNQFIGELNIKKDPQNKAYSLHAKRQYRVSSLDKLKPNLYKIAAVEWGADSSNVFFPQSTDSKIIFYLRTKKEPHNQGIVIASIDEVGGDGKANVMDGVLYYLMPKSPITGSPYWVEARMTLRRKINKDDDNYYIQSKIISEWYADHSSR